MGVCVKSSAELDQCGRPLRPVSECHLVQLHGGCVVQEAALGSAYQSKLGLANDVWLNSVTKEATSVLRRAAAGSVPGRDLSFPGAR